VTVQGFVPLQALHRARKEPASGTAIRFATVPLVKLAEQTPGQLIPPGPVTVPLPVPTRFTVRVNIGSFTTKSNVVVLPKGDPVTVIGKVPVGVAPVVAIVRVFEQVGLQEAGRGENVAVAPAGRTEVTARLTACVAPETKVAVIVLKPEAPWMTVMFPELERE